MTTLKHLAQFNAFMKWFERCYPELYKQHHKHLLPAVDETGFIIKSGSISEESFGILLQITNDYHYLIHK